MLETAVSFLIANADIIRWATCLMHGPGYEDRIVEKLTKTWSVDTRLDITCDDGGDKHGSIRPCPEFLALSFALFGVNICTETNQVDTWLRLFASSDPDERLCGLIDLSSTLVHELTHVALTFRSGDLSSSREGDLDETCSRSHLLQSIYQWAIYQRYPQALRAECCAQVGDAFMDSHVLGTSPVCEVRG